MLKRIKIDEKYTLVIKKDGSFKALRYGQEWRDLTGDKLVLTMCQRIEQLEEKIMCIQLPKKVRETTNFRKPEDEWGLKDIGANEWEQMGK